MARLSTHVLDTTRGKPAQNVLVDLHSYSNGERRLIKSASTNADGRTGEPLLAGDAIEPGIYELTFHAGDYFRGAGVELADPPFLSDIVIRFGLADPTANYHVPLLLSPYGYSTYRGS
jgi:5-hydroxyisourate hydrolase